MPILEFEYILSGNESVCKRVGFQCDVCNERLWTKGTKILTVEEIELRKKTGHKVYCNYCYNEEKKFQNNAKSKAGFLCLTGD